MHINLLPFAVFWGVLALVVLALIIYRRSVTANEDDSIHLEGGAPSAQVALDHRIGSIDRWGKTMTAVTVVYGVILAAIYLYQVWNTIPSY